MKLRVAPETRKGSSNPLPDARALSEARNAADVLAIEADQARRELAATWRKLTGQLCYEASPTTWVRRHPWGAMGVSAAAGTALGWELTRKKRERRAAGASGQPRFEGDSPPRFAAQASHSHAPLRSSWIWSLLRPAFASLSEAAKLWLTRFVVGLVEAATGDPSPPVAPAPTDSTSPRHPAAEQAAGIEPEVVAGR